MVKKGRIVAFFVVIILLAVLIGWTSKPLINKVKLGLDLQGGFEVLYHVDSIDDGKPVTNKMLKETVSALRQRINVLGVSEPRIQIESGNNIRVSLAGVKDQAHAREILSTTAHLTFRNAEDKLMLDGSAMVPGSAKVEYGQLNKPVVTMKFKDASEFANVTKKILNNPPADNVLVIWLDYQKGDSYREEVKKEDPKYISAPSVSKVISSKDVEITGDFTQEEANTLKELLNAGSLPVNLKEIYSTSVGAQFGQNAMETTIFAGIIGIAAIFLFMLFFYRFGGLISVITLIVYMYLVMAVFVGLEAVLTLPGIAALILGVGMAVDANVITLERIKDELRSGKSILSAYKSGSRRAFGTILDANLTTILAGAVMFIYGTSDVQGFAVMLIVSIVVSFVTAVFGARILTSFWVKSRALDKKPGLFGVKKGDINEL